MADILVTARVSEAVLYTASPTDLDGDPAQIQAGSLTGSVESGAVDGIVPNPADPTNGLQLVFVPPAEVSPTDPVTGLPVPHVYVATADGDPTSGESFINDRILVTMVPDSAAVLGGGVTTIPRPVLT